MSEFNSLSTFTDWSDKLADMLDEAAAATKAKDDRERLSIAARLRAFVKASPPLMDGSAQLDAIALNGAAMLGDSVINDAIERIRGRTAEFMALKKQIDAVTDKAERDAAMVRLEPARAAVDSLTAAVRALQDFDAVLKDGTDDELKGKITTILKSIEGAKAVIEKAAEP